MYENERQHQEILASYMTGGLAAGQKTIYLYDAHDRETILAYLRDAGIDPAPALASGQLELYPARKIYLPHGVFDPHAMLQFVQEVTRRALDEGYPGLRSTGEMSWALGESVNSEQLNQYELAINELETLDHAIILCQYDRRRFDPQALLDVLMSHPLVAIGPYLYDSFCYIPPSSAPAKDRSVLRLEHWLDALVERQRMEWQLEQTRGDLQQRYQEQQVSLVKTNSLLKEEQSQRHGVEKALRQSEDRFRALTESSPEGIMLADQDGVVVDVNASQSAIFGLPADQLLGSRLPDLYFALLQAEQAGPDDRQAFARRFSGCQSGSAEWQGLVWEKPIRRPDGEQRYIQVVHFPIYTANRHMIGTITHDLTAHHLAELELERYRQDLEVMVTRRTAELEERSEELQREIQERQNIEEALFEANQALASTNQAAKQANAALALANSELQESEERYRVLVSESPVTILVAQEGRYVFANQAGASYLGYTNPEDLNGTWVLDSIAPASRERAVARMKRAEAGSANKPEVLAYLCKNGSVVQSESSSVPIMYRGRPAILMVGKDATERMRYEKELEASLEEKEVMLREIHHRVKNNLNVIISLIDLQRSSILDPELVHAFKDLQTRVYTMALVHETLYRSPNLSEINFSKYLQTLTEYLCLAYQVHPGTVSIRVQAQPISLKIETAIPCGLIVNELVTNALKYAFPPARKSDANSVGCEIVVSMALMDDGCPACEEGTGCDRANHCLRLTVCDNGTGLPAGYDWTAPATLGLQLVQVLAGQLGGRLEMESNGGVCWCLYFREE